MSIFNLPDLGEGLPDAEIVKWLVKEGDVITCDQPMVEMETAKAVVEMPAPFTGVVVKQYGQPGDVITTGDPLIEIAADRQVTDVQSTVKNEIEDDNQRQSDRDTTQSNTVVGTIEVGDHIVTEQAVTHDGIKVTPVVRALARKLKVDLAQVKCSLPDGSITLSDVRNSVTSVSQHTCQSIYHPTATTITKAGPAARAKARELNINLVTVKATGPNDSITVADVESTAEQLKYESDNSHQVTVQSDASIAISAGKGIKAAPKVRALARELGVDIRQLTPTGYKDNITTVDVYKQKWQVYDHVPVYSRPERAQEATGKPLPIRGARRTMVQAMADSHANVVNTTLYDDADISTWLGGTDITLRIIRAIVAACMQEPALNAWFDKEKMERTLHPHVNVGVAVDSPQGLYVPVIKNADKQTDREIRQELHRMSQAIKDRTIQPTELQGATITLSNFGMIAGRYATPIVSPPEVAIVGTGRLYDELKLTEHGIQNKQQMPLSLSFDHRTVTGGEAARFLAAMMVDLGLAY